MMKFVICLFILTCCSTTMRAQLEEVATSARSEVKESHRSFRYTSQQQDTVRIMVISPRGEMQAMPVKEEKLSVSGQVEFTLDTKYWRPGTYTLVAEGNRGYRSTKQVVIKRKPKP